MITAGIFLIGDGLLLGGLPGFVLVGLGARPGVNYQPVARAGERRHGMVAASGGWCVRLPQEVGMASPGTQYRQGDVLLIAMRALLAGLEAVPMLAQEPRPLVDGPAAGSHVLPCSRALRLYRQPDGGTSVSWIEVIGQGVTLDHHQHAPLTLEPGIWRVVRQREYDPVAGSRRVVD